MNCPKCKSRFVQKQKDGTLRCFHCEGDAPTRESLPSNEAPQKGRPRTGEYRKCQGCGDKIYVRRHRIDSGKPGLYCRKCASRLAAKALRGKRTVSKQAAAPAIEQENSWLDVTNGLIADWQTDLANLKDKIAQYRDEIARLEDDVMYLEVYIEASRELVKTYEKKYPRGGTIDKSPE